MYKKEGGTTHGMTFNCHMKSIDIWIETIIKKSVVFCSGYNAPNLYRIIQKICIYIQIYEALCPLFSIEEVQFMLRQNL